MISEQWLMRIALTAAFSLLLLLYVVYGRNFFFRKVPTLKTRQKLATVEWIAIIIAIVTIFLFLLVTFFFLVGA